MARRPDASTSDFDATSRVIGPKLAHTYRLIERIADGERCWIYRAQHRRDLSFVALKVLKDPNPGDSAPWQRAHREASLLFPLRHPHVLRYLDFDCRESGVVFVTELLRGRTLEQALSGPTASTLLSAVALGVGSGLAELHAHRIVHRRLEPAHIFLVREADGSERPVLLGFGNHYYIMDPTGLTVLSTYTPASGSARYLSPEQILSEPATPAADLYSLGLLLYELASGKPPFTAECTLSLCVSQLHEAPPPLRPRPALLLNSGQAALIMACLAKNSEERPRDGADFLSRWRAGFH